MNKEAFENNTKIILNVAKYNLDVAKYNLGKVRLKLMQSAVFSCFFSCSAVC